MVSKRIAVGLTIVVLVMGAVLIALGMAVIEGSRQTVTQGFGIGMADGFFVYYVWNEYQLAMGIALTLVGTAMSTATLTYLMLTRKRREV